MIVHTIAPYKESVPVSKAGFSQQFLDKYTGGEYGDITHKEFIFNRCLSKCKFSEGEMVFHGSTPAVIEHIEDSFGRVGWDGLKCLYILIATDKDYYLVHHSDIIRVGK